MILHRYILRNHLAPFAFSVLTLICIFLLQFLMKFADRLVGKGLDTFVVIQLIIYNLAWMVVLVVPMASLVAALMAFGTMSQNNEITILKSSGISLYRMMLAPLSASVIVGFLLILFNNDVLPDANHQAKNLMQDISRKKPTLSLEPGIFSQEVANYAILVRAIDQNSNELTNLTIYDYTNPVKVNVVTAEKGRLFFSKDQTKLIMDLQNGEIHESESGETSLYRKLEFQKHRISMNAEQFSFQQTGPGGPRGDRELSTRDMLVIIDSLKVKRDEYVGLMQKEVNRFMYIDTLIPLPPVDENQVKNKDLIYARALDKIRGARNIIMSNYKRVEYAQSEINKYWVEVHKKYSLPAACFIFVLIGAPLGVMTKKGGFGVAAGISLFFFLIYWAFLIGGEKLADRNMLSPFLGMWAANILLGVAGVFLTFRTVKETITLEFSFVKKLLPKQWREIQDKENENT
ncbi:MAG: LptF/LptG family permease [Ignavibacteriaceae bacterium]